jgi:hypothetical protein
MIIHKQNRAETPKVSVILLDWTCREHFHSLDWLSDQDVPREFYELVWVELYEQTAEEVLRSADVVITCQQKGRFHKHNGYNVGLLHSRGTIITVCDSDAVFPRNFISSILASFHSQDALNPQPLVLMHHEYRSRSTYPADLNDRAQLAGYSWEELDYNVGASLSVRRADAIRFGGFDEHHSFKSRLCGPYDLGWRLVNAGIPEKWHAPDVALWHFAHPLPPSPTAGFWIKRSMEITYPHVEYHALSAVEAFSTGRILPLRENAEIHDLRMQMRKIGSIYEERYARFTPASGFSTSKRVFLWCQLLYRAFAELTGLKIVAIGRNALNVLSGAQKSALRK